jgi:hypothetical protein
MVTANGGTSTPDAATSLREALHLGMGRTESGTLLQRATSTATSRARRHKRAKPLSLLPLVALCFYDVSGGPFGIEVRRYHFGMHAVPMPDGCAAARVCMQCCDHGQHRDYRGLLDEARLQDCAQCKD